MTHTRQAEDLELSWKNSERWNGVKRVYDAKDVIRLRGSVTIEHTLARLGAKRFWYLLQTSPYVAALGAVTGNQAIQQVEAGLRAIYVSGWQIAADANTSGHMYPDQSLYPADSAPRLVRNINQALQRADQIQWSEGRGTVGYFAPIIADAEAGFGGNLNAFEITKSLIEAGAAAVHFEDQLTSAKKCGHMGGKVLVPAMEFIQKLSAARLAADVMGVPTVIIARTDANGAYLLTSNHDPRDHEFLTGERTVEGYFRYRGGIEAAIARGLAYAPYADVIWCETSEPNLEEARQFAEAIHSHFPRKILAYNCSPSFNWRRKLDSATISKFNDSLAEMGYRFHFVTLAGFHALNHSMFDLALDFQHRGMAAYADFQVREFESERRGYRATTHQRFVGTGYFDELAQKIAGGSLSTAALHGSTEEDQFGSMSQWGTA